MLDREEIEKRLESVDPQLCVAFAVRCSLRSLPSLLTSEGNEAFWYWDKEKRPYYVLALMNSLLNSIHFSVFGSKFNISANNTSFAIAADAADAISFVNAKKASVAANIFTHTVYAADAAYRSLTRDKAWTTVEYVADIVGMANDIHLEVEVLNDLSILTNKTTTPPLLDFLYSSLWVDVPSKDWQLLYSNFNQALLDFNMGFELWVSWYRNRVNCIPLDKKQEEYRLYIPAEIKEQGVKATNAYLSWMIAGPYENTFKPLNLVRAIFIGNGAAGKTEHEIGKQGLDQEAFLGLLDALGEIIHFPELEWSDAYVLNPRWLTYGVYTLLYSDEVKVQQGLLSRSDVVRILQSEKVVDEQGNQLTYPKTKCGFIVDAMTQFKLCYQLADSGHYVIPDKLPKDQPDLSDYFDKNKEGTLAFEFSFSGLLPRNIMPNLIVARHTEIVKDEQGKQLVWQRGVIINNMEHQATARWKVDYHQRTLQ